MGLVSSFRGGLYRSLFGGRRAELDRPRPAQVGGRPARRGRRRPHRRRGGALLDTVIIGHRGAGRRPASLDRGRGARSRAAVTAVSCGGSAAASHPRRPTSTSRRSTTPATHCRAAPSWRAPSARSPPSGLGGADGPRGLVDLPRHHHRLPGAAGRPPLLRRATIGGCCSWPARRPVWPPSSRHRPPGPSSPSRSRTRTTSPATCCIPSLVGAATGYLTFAAFHGTESLFPHHRRRCRSTTSTCSPPSGSGPSPPSGPGCSPGACGGRRTARTATPPGNGSRWRGRPRRLRRSSATGPPARRSRSVPATRRSPGPSTRTGRCGRWPCCSPCAAWRPSP